MFNGVVFVVWNFIANVINSMFKFVSWFLANIVVAPAQIPQSVENIYSQVQEVSIVLISVAVVYAFAKSSVQSLSGQGEDAKEIIGRAIIAVFLARFAWTIFMEWLVPLNNVIVEGILDNFSNINPSMAGGWALPVVSTVGAFVGSMNIGVLMVLALLAIIFLIAACLAVIVWIKRSAQLIQYIILAPIAAALTAIGKHVVSWRWLFQEMIATIFSQSILALTVYLGFFVISGGGTNSGADIWDPENITDPNMGVVNFAVGVALIFLSLKAPAIIKGFASGAYHSNIEAGIGMAVGHAIGNNFVPSNVQLAGKMFGGQLGFGEFSQAGRAMQVASQANSALGQLENQGVVSQAAEAQSLSNVAKIANPHTRAAMAKEAIYSQAGVNQDPGVLAAKGVSKNAQSYFNQATQGITSVDVSKVDQGMNDLSGAYRDFGYGEEYPRESTSSVNMDSNSNLPSKVSGNIVTNNPYTKN